MARFDDSVRSYLDRWMTTLGEAGASRGRMDRTQLAHLAVAGVFLLVVLASAAWTIGARLVPPADGQRVEAAEALPAPVLTGLAPRQRLRPRADVQPVALSGRHFLPDMTVTITMPDGRIATYGSEALSNVTPTTLTLRAIFDLPGTYHLTFRTTTGTHSNGAAVAVAR